MDGEKVKDREGVIIKTSVIAIITNIFLVAFKMFVGLITNSIAVILDAVNNLSDAISSIITIVGTKLSNKLPDKKHPLGYGRIEYITTMIVSGLVLYAGLTSLVESVKNIINPEPVNYTLSSLVIISSAIIVKFLLGRYVKIKGKKVGSQTLVASGSDAIFDGFLSLSVLASAVVFILTKISLEAYVGAVISVLIIRSGIEMILDALNDILGVRADSKLTEQIKKIITENPQIQGAYDLVIYNYGANKVYASVHIELPDTMTVAQVDKITREAETKVFDKTGVILAGVGVYSYNTIDTSAVEIRDKIYSLQSKYKWIVGLHGFYLDKVAKEMRFDAVISFDIDQKTALKILYANVGAMFPDYKVFIAPDVDVS